MKQILEFKSEYDFVQWAKGKRAILYVRVSGDEQAKNDNPDVEGMEEFWKHWSIVTGHPAPRNAPSFFSCNA